MKQALTVSTATAKSQESRDTIDAITLAAGAAIQRALATNNQLSDEDTRQLRKVVAREHGEAVANSLQGRALMDMVGKCVKLPVVNAQHRGVPDMAEHFGYDKPPTANAQQSGAPDLEEHFGYKAE